LRVVGFEVVGLRNDGLEVVAGLRVVGFAIIGTFVVGSLVLHDIKPQRHSAGNSEASLSHADASLIH
jgi:hypothetical protein